MTSTPSASKTPNASLRRKRSARIAAVQGLYNRELTATTLAPEKHTDQLMHQWQDSIATSDIEWPSTDLPDKPMLLDIMVGVAARLADIDAIIAPYIKSDWRQERMDPTLIAILRAATYELHFKPERKTAIILNEYVTIASGFLGDTEHGFANSVLQRVAAERPQAA